MNKIDYICEIENRRLKNILDYILDLSFDYEIIRNSVSFINDSCKCSNIESLVNTKIQIKYKAINDFCSLLIFTSMEKEETITKIFILSEQIDLKSLSELNINDDYNKFYCEKSPVINVYRVREFLINKILKRKTLFGNNISFFNYSICYHNNVLTSKRVSYSPYDDYSKNNRRTTSIDLIDNKIRFFANDIYEIEESIIERWIDVFYNYNDDPRKITEMVGYYNFLEIFKNKNVDWTSFIDEEKIKVR